MSKISTQFTSCGDSHWLNEPSTLRRLRRLHTFPLQRHPRHLLHPLHLRHRRHLRHLRHWRRHNARSLNLMVVRMGLKMADEVRLGELFNAIVEISGTLCRPQRRRNFPGRICRLFRPDFSQSIDGILKSLSTKDGGAACWLEMIVDFFFIHDLSYTTALLTRYSFACSSLLFAAEVPILMRSRARKSALLLLSIVRVITR